MDGDTKIAFVCPRFAGGSNAGGAETLLGKQAEHLAELGYEVTYLTTCATDHFSWKNSLPPGEQREGKIKVIRFPVDHNRDIGAFLDVQTRISRAIHVTGEEENVWLRNNVTSTALCDYLKSNSQNFDKIVMGPYLFGLIFYAAQIKPDKTFLVPCLHDEPFAYLKCFKAMFESARGIMFNSAPEKALAERLFDISRSKTSIVGMGLDPFDAEPSAFATAKNMHSPYIIYSGRREGLKGTPMLIDYFCTFRQRTGLDIKLVLTGSGAVQLPDDAIQHVIDLGFVTEREKQEAMAGAVAFCHPSALESFGIVVLESWLAGTPAIINARSEVLRHQCQTSNGGLWFRNYPEFEEELLLLIKDRSTRDRLGQNGKHYVMQEFSWPAIEKKLTEALDLKS